MQVSFFSSCYQRQIWLCSFSTRYLLFYPLPSSTNARGECVLKPKTFAGCRKGKKRFNTFSTSGGNACISNQFFNSECQAAIAGQNIPLRPNDEVEALDSEEFDHEEFVSAEDEWTSLKGAIWNKSYVSCWLSPATSEYVHNMIIYYNNEC